MAVASLALAAGPAAGDVGPPQEAGPSVDAPVSVSATGPNEAGGHRSALERVWFAAGTNMAARGIHARRQALELGIDNAEAAARALMVSGREDDALAHRMLAVRLAPDLPAAHMALAREYWVVGEYRNSLAEVVVGIIAIPQHLEASIWLVGSLLMMLATVLIAGSLVFIVVVGVSTFGNAAHDVGDPISNKMPSFSRVALLCSVVLVPLALGEGPMGLVIAIFAVGFVYLGSSHRMVMTMAVVLLVLGLYPILQIAGKVLTALEADPVATASLSVVRDMANDDQLELLAEAELAGDEMAARVLALYARRRGDRADAAERYGRLIRRDAADPLVLTTLGNMAFEEERTDEAIGYYERARALQESTVLMFNLSQAYAKAFRMEEFEHTMQRAQALGADEVMELSGVGDTSFVADMPFSISMIRDRMLEEADGDAFSGALVRVLAPGRLGESWAHMAGSFLFAALLAAIIAGRYQHASRCGRCGRRICARCDDSMWSSDLCDGCHHLFHRPQGTDPALRMARLQALRVRESRVEKVGLALSMIVPGASGLLAKRPDLCFIGILFFGWALVLFVWRNGVVADPLAVGAAGTLAFVLAGCVMAIGYVGVLLSGLVIRRSL